MNCGYHVTCGEILLRLLAIGLSNGAIIALNAIGVTLIYGTVRLINFAHGDLFALTTVVVGTIVAGLGLQSGMQPALLIGGLILTLGAAMGFGALLDVAIERAAFRPFRSRSRLAPLIATIGISFIIYQAALFWRTTESSFIPGEHRSVPGVPEVPRGRLPELLPDINLVSAAGLDLRVVYTLKDLFVLLLAVGLALLVSWFLRRTSAGRALRACSQDAEMAELCGVDRNRTIRLAFALGGGLGGAAAFVFALYYNHPYTSYGAQSALVAFTAAVLGGIGIPAGAFVSSLLLGVLASFSDYFLSAHWTPVLVLAILIVLLTLRPTGLASQGQSDEPASPAIEVMTRRGQGQYRARGRWLTGALLALALIYPALDYAFGLHQQVILVSVLIFALLALGLNLMLGFAGLLDLGYAACFGIGGYAAALLTTPGGSLSALLPGPVDFLVVLAASAAAAGIFGALNALLARRLRGEYLAIVTLAFGQLIPRVALNLDRWTGGSAGIAALPPPRLLTHTLKTPTELYYLALALVLVAAVASQRLGRSRLGRAWAAITADEAAAASCGVDVSRAKGIAFVLGTMTAGMAGALFASAFSYVDPGQSEFRVSAMVLAMVVIGGAGSVRGAIIGALLVAGYDQLLIPLLGTWVEQLAQTSGIAALAAFDPRALNFLSFGLALYLTMLLRGRRMTNRV